MTCPGRSPPIRAESPLLRYVAKACHQLRQKTQVGYHSQAFIPVKTFSVLDTGESLHQRFGTIVANAGPTMLRFSNVCSHGALTVIWRRFACDVYKDRDG
jgi:hypothetical protein